MPIEGFDYKEFARNLAEQVGPALPPDILEADRNYIVNIVYNFCFMAGEAVFNDSNLNFNAEQASIVAQVIGEWSFHKSIDIIKAGIDPQFRDGILQKIAFTIFEIAKTAIIKQIPQADMISIVEHHVKKAYGEALEDLKNKGALNEEQVNNALNFSNIDEMAKTQAEAQLDEQNHSTEQHEASTSGYAPNNETKIFKLATFAIVLKYLPEDKRQGILNRFSEEDATILRDYVAMDGLQEQMDTGLVLKCVKEMKKVLPEPKIVNRNKTCDRVYKIVKNSDISKISNIMIKERQYLRNFVTSAGQKNVEDIPVRVAEIVSNYLETKLNL